VSGDPHYHGVGDKMWDLATQNSNDGFNRGKHLGDHDNWLNTLLGFGGTSDGTEWVFPTMNIGSGVGANSGGEKGWVVCGQREQGYAMSGAEQGFVINCYVKTENDYGGPLVYDGEDGVWVEFGIASTFSVHDGSGPDVNIAGLYPAYSTLRVELVESVGGIFGV